MSSFRINLLSATIASGQSLSNAVFFDQSAVVGLYIPTGTSITAATFQLSADGSTFYNVVEDDGTEYQAIVAAGQYVPLTLNNFLGGRYMKVRAGTTSSPSSQSTATIFQVAMKEV